MASPKNFPIRFVAFYVVASTIDGKPVYSVADIIEPKPRYAARLLRSSRLIAGPRGYVLVGRNESEWSDFEASARRINGLYSRPAASQGWKAA